MKQTFTKVVDEKVRKWKLTDDF